MFLVKVSLVFWLCLPSLVLADTAKYINAKDWGAVGNGTTNDTVALQLALNQQKPVFIPAGVYLVTDELTIDYPGQIVSGAGGARTLLKINTSFNSSARGVFVPTNTSGAGPVIRDMRIEFFQPYVCPTRNHLNVYPPAVYINGVKGVKIQNVGIIWAWHGVKLQGNIEGFYAEDIEMLSFDSGFWFDNVQGKAGISGFHFWGFGSIVEGRGVSWTDPATGIVYNDLNNRYREVPGWNNSNPDACIAVKVGACTDFVTIEKMMALNPYGLIMTSSSSKVRLIDGWMERSNGIIQHGGTLLVEGHKFSFASVDGFALWKLDGEAVLNNTRHLASGTNRPHIINEAGNMVICDASIYRTGNTTDMNTVRIIGGNVRLRNVVFYSYVGTPAYNPTVPTVRVQDAGRLSMIGCRVIFTGASVSLGNDNKHVIVGNRFATTPTLTCSTCQIDYNN